MRDALSVAGNIRRAVSHRGRFRAENAFHLLATPPSASGCAVRRGRAMPRPPRRPSICRRPASP